MGIYKHPGSPYWYYNYTVDGKRITRSSRTTNKTEARQIYEAEKIDALRGKSNLPKKFIGFTVLRDRYLEWSKIHKRSHSHDIIVCRHLTRFFGKRSLHQIKLNDVEQYQQHRRRLVSGATVNREVACLKRIFNLGMKWEIVSENPVKGVEFFQEPKRSFRWWTKEEIKKFISASDDRIRAIAIIGVNTGMRIGELLNLKWSQIDFENDYITIEESKTNTYRKVKMNKVVREAIDAMDKPHDYVFANSNGEPFKRITKAFKSTCRRAGIKESTPHVMRHTFASHLAMCGVDVHTIMELGGWKSLELVMRYSHLAPEHKQQAVDKLVDLLK